MKLNLGSLTTAWSIAGLALLGSFQVTSAAAAGAGRSMPAAQPTAQPAARPSTGMLGPTHPTGQPNQSCGSATAPNTPGQAAGAPGSAFNPNGQAGSVYAGQQPQNSKNVASVAQYDVACFNQTKH
jgi:hypothetical protein